jgi:ribonuclease HI
MEINYSKDIELNFEILGSPNYYAKLKREDDNISTLTFMDEHYKVIPIPDDVRLENTSGTKAVTIQNSFVLFQVESYRLKRTGETLLELNDQRVHAICEKSRQVKEKIKQLKLTEKEIKAFQDIGIVINMYFDGISKSNPGKSGCGSVIYDNGVRHEVKKFLGNHCTNNEAEYSGLILGLEHVVGTMAGRQGMSVVVHGDSKLVIEQMSGNWKINAENLRSLNVIAQELVQTLKKNGTTVEFKWIPREKNGEADALANSSI